MSLLLLSSALLAVPAERSGTADDLLRCRAIVADAERLACFDRLAGRVSANEVVVIDRKRLSQERQKRFGLPAQEDGALAAATSGRVAEVREFSGKVKAAQRASDYGRWNIELADGTVWQSIDVSAFGPAAGAAITIRRASLGGFRASVPGRPSFLVKRLR